MNLSRRPWSTIFAAAIALGFGLGAPAQLLASTAPDLSVAVTGPVVAGAGSPFQEAVTVTNQGTAPAPGVTVAYTTGGRAIVPLPSPGLSCSNILHGHSGRDGGYTTIGQTCSETVAGGLAPGQSAQVTMSALERSAETLTLAFSAAPYPAGPQLDLVSHNAATSIQIIRPPAAAAPTNISVSQAGDSLSITWTADPATAAYISSSRITATPAAGSTAPALTGTVLGTATQALLPGLLASTTYSVTVANDDAGGPGASSDPAAYTTVPASVAPRRPVITYYWGYADIRWSPPDAGNSAIDQNEVRAIGDGHVLRSYVPGSATSDYQSPPPADILKVQVRAHNAAGWGRWSKPVYFTDGG